MHIFLLLSFFQKLYTSTFLTDNARTTSTQQQEMDVKEDINELWIEEGSIVSKEVDYIKDHTYRIEDSETQLMTVRKYYC